MFKIFTDFMKQKGMLSDNMEDPLMQLYNSYPGRNGTLSSTSLDGVSFYLFPCLSTLSFSTILLLSWSLSRCVLPNGHISPLSLSLSPTPLLSYSSFLVHSIWLALPPFAFLKPRFFLFPSPSYYICAFELSIRPTCMLCCPSS